MCAGNVLVLQSVSFARYTNKLVSEVGCDLKFGVQKDHHCHWAGLLVGQVNVLSSGCIVVPVKPSFSIGIWSTERHFSCLVSTQVCKGSSIHLIDDYGISLCMCAILSVCVCV